MTPFALPQRAQPVYSKYQQRFFLRKVELDEWQEDTGVYGMIYRRNRGKNGQILYEPLAFRVYAPEIEPQATDTVEMEQETVYAASIYTSEVEVRV